MVNSSLYTWVLRYLAALAIGGSVFQVGSCDPGVRSTLVSGLATTTEALAGTLIDVFFASLADDDDVNAGLTTR